MSTAPLIIDYYTDVLCIWAWVAQRRIHELSNHFGEKIAFRHLYIDVFGDTAQKLQLQWAKKGGYKGFAEYVQHSAAAFEAMPVNLSIWNQVRPATSANAHMVIKAVETAYGKQVATDLALNIRSAFFVDAQDIGDLGFLYRLVKKQGLETTPINNAVNDGRAMASLMSDYQQAKQQGIKGSPSYVIDGGRQTLYGNVGYRVLHANIEELIKKPSNEASWC